MGTLRAIRVSGSIHISRAPLITYFPFLFHFAPSILYLAGSATADDVLHPGKGVVELLCAHSWRMCGFRRGRDQQNRADQKGHRSLFSREATRPESRHGSACMRPSFVLYPSSSAHIRWNDANLPLEGSFVATYTNAASATQGTESSRKGKRHPKLLAHPVKPPIIYAACGKQGERVRDKSDALAMNWVLISAKDMCLACRLLLDTIRRYHSTQSVVLLRNIWLM